MRQHPEEFHIQMAATACVYNLTKGDIGQKVHPHVLREVVQCTLAAMENFPNNLQVLVHDSFMHLPFYYCFFSCLNLQNSFRKTRC